MHASRQPGLAAAYLWVSLLIGLIGCHASAPSTSAGLASRPPVDPGTAARLHFFQQEVQPTLQANCMRCHGGMNRRGGFNMSTRAATLQGGKDGAVVIPGRPQDSLLVRVIGPELPEGDPLRMPPKGERLTARQVAAIRQWIADGVVMDR